MPKRRPRARQTPPRVIEPKMSKVARMVRRVQRDGGGVPSVSAISRRASSPGPRRSRSRRGWGSLKMPPAPAALGMGDQPGGPLRPVAAQPRIHGIGVAGPQQPGAGHAMGGGPLGDLEEGGAALADVGPWVVVAQPKEFLALFFGQGQGTPGHG